MRRLAWAAILGGALTLGGAACESRPLDDEPTPAAGTGAGADYGTHCPSGDWWALERISCDPAQQPGDCVRLGSCEGAVRYTDETLSCSQVYRNEDGIYYPTSAYNWVYSTSRGECDTSMIIIGADGCPDRWEDADRRPCTKEGVSCVSNDDACGPADGWWLDETITCTHQRWEYSFSEGPCDDEESGLGGTGGASGAGGAGGAGGAD